MQRTTREPPQNRGRDTYRRGGRKFATPVGRIANWQARSRRPPAWSGSRRHQRVSESRADLTLVAGSLDMAASREHDRATAQEPA